MKKVLCVFLSMTMVVISLCAFSITSLAEEKNGWIKEQASFYYDAEERMEYLDYEMYYYYIDGVKATGFQVIDGETYYFDRDGWLKKGLFWDPDTDIPYFANTDGIIQRNCWQDVDLGSPEEDYSYVLRFYFGSDGAGYIGWRTVDGTLYHFSDDEMAHTGAMSRYLYYEEATGKSYYFDYDGIMQKNRWVNIDYSDEIEGFIDWFYVGSDGVVYTGWHKIKNTWYYFDETYGNMATGWQKINKKWYYFNKSGAMQIGWKKVSGKWYYFNSGGAMQTSWKKISGKWYYFNKSGAMTTGWQKINKKWYYFESSGAMKTGWLKSGGKWYYLKADGSMAANTSLKIGKKTYKFNVSGVCTNP